MRVRVFGCSSKYTTNAIENGLHGVNELCVEGCEPFCLSTALYTHSVCVCVYVIFSRAAYILLSEYLSTTTTKEVMRTNEHGLLMFHHHIA